jgi:hypothetical protein
MLPAPEKKASLGAAAPAACGRGPPPKIRLTVDIFKPNQRI